MIEEEARLLFDLVEDVTGVTEQEILSKNRAPRIISAKRSMAVVLDENTNHKQPIIARVLGVHRCNIYHYNQTHVGLMETESEFRDNFNKINLRFKSHQNNGYPVEMKLENKINERKELNKEINKLRKLVAIKNK